ncbi:hypothetical protein Lbru_0773 [Legionella brunensis]|uniref:Protein glutaminase domain-containing protein n=1 Tax=Legionella brunensis TaxID=29422 RepID=A0A0W0SS99_9GAMM|nr:hypothetical protein Lbru_0773 [Legionella brunensis]
MFFKIDKMQGKKSLIERPQQNSTYEIKCSYLPKGKMTISLMGNFWPSIESVNLSALMCRFFSGKVLNLSAICSPFFPVSDESLPPGVLDLGIPLVFYDGQSTLSAINSLKLTIDNGGIDIGAEGAPFKTNVELHNDILQQECQALVGSIKVKVGEYPILKAKFYPDFDFLSNLYKNFWKYNKNKLSTQYANTAGYCHIRAHFVSTMLAYYGIDSVKIYKLWNNEDWQAFDDNKSWGFHSAVLVTDNDNKKWVWDSWVGLNSQLLEMNDWLNRKNEPKPFQVVIGNRSIIDDFYNGRQSYLSFEYGSTPEYYNAFQAILGSAIPNSPQPMISLGYNFAQFFNARKCKHKEEEHAIQLKTSSVF